MLGTIVDIARPVFIFCMGINWLSFIPCHLQFRYIVSLWKVPGYPDQSALTVVVYCNLDCVAERAQ